MQLMRGFKAAGSRRPISVTNKISEGINDLSLRQLKYLANVLYFAFTVSYIELIQHVSFPYQEH